MVVVTMDRNCGGLTGCPFPINAHHRCDGGRWLPKVHLSNGRSSIRMFHRQAVADRSGAITAGHSNRSPIHKLRPVVNSTEHDVNATAIIAKKRRR
jgi:hypothetical protein